MGGEISAAIDQDASIDAIGQRWNCREDDLIGRAEAGDRTQVERGTRVWRGDGGKGKRARASAGHGNAGGGAVEREGANGFRAGGAVVDEIERAAVAGEGSGVEEASGGVVATAVVEGEGTARIHLSGAGIPGAA